LFYDIAGKRQLLSYILQNPLINGKKLSFAIASSLNLVLELAENPNWLRIVNNVRTIIEKQNEYIYIPDLRTYSNA